ncbi:hypothetical protein ACP4OV_014077 [Aristida adscensionis]
MDECSATGGSAVHAIDLSITPREAMLQAGREYAAMHQHPPSDEKFFADFCHPMNLPWYVYTVGDLDLYYRYRVHCMIDGEEPTEETDIYSVDGQMHEGMEEDEEDDAMSVLVASPVHEAPAAQSPVM